MTEPEYKEVQQPYRWVWLALAAIGCFPFWLMAFEGHPFWPTVAPTALCLFLALFFLPLTLLVEEGRLRVVFGFIPLFVWNYSLEQIEKAEAVTYSPLRTYLGWGIRRGLDGSKALTIRGNRGVRLHLRNGKRVLIGSQRPDQLAAAITKGLTTPADEEK